MRFLKTYPKKMPAGHYTFQVRWRPVTFTSARDHRTKIWSSVALSRDVISCSWSRYLIPALAVQILCSRSSYSLPHSTFHKTSNQTDVSETTRRDTFFQQVPPVHLASSDHIVCMLSSPLWNSHVFASSASPMKFIARTAGLQPHSQKPGQDTNPARSNGALALLERLCASVFIG